MKGRAFDYLRSEVHVLKISAWFVWDLRRVQRSRGKDVRWPMELSMRMAPCPTTRSSSLRVPGATRSRSGELVVATQGRRLLANCAGGSRPLQRLLANLAGGSRRSLQRVLANCAGDSQRLLAGPDLVELAGLAELAE